MPELDEEGLRSFFGDGTVLLPERKIEGETLFIILSKIGVEIFDKVIVTTVKVFSKSHKEFAGSRMSFMIGDNSLLRVNYTYKVDVEILNHGYGIPVYPFIIFKLFKRKDFYDNQSDWLRIMDLSREGCSPLQEKFRLLKEKLLEEI